MGNLVSALAKMHLPPGQQGPGGPGIPQGPGGFGGQQGPGQPGMFSPGNGFSGQSSFQPGGPGGPGGVGGGQGGINQQRPPLPPPELMRDLGEILKTRPEELASKLLSGQSLSQVAGSQGMSGDQLRSAITDLLGNRQPQLNEDQRAAMAAGIVAGLPPPPPLPQMQANGGQ
ncbi:MAG TPA: hypothetical protein VFU23_09775 [Gemmatimonadales bacterium]|nr:hypothetical protein [Gemmatimonadales bacterium]